MPLDPFRFVLIALAGWMNQRQLQVIEYLREENRVLREQLGERRLRLSDDQRRRLAAKAKGSAHHRWDRAIGGSNGGRESELGISADSGRPIQSGIQACSQHDRCDFGKARHRTGTGANSQDELEGISDATLGIDCGCGFLHR